MPVPFHLFLSEDGGFGKLHLIKTIFHSVSKLFFYQDGSPDKSRVLLLTPTNVAVINVNGTTIHSVLNIPSRSKLMPLSDEKCAELRSKYPEVQVVTINEISVVSDKFLYQIQTFK